MGHRLVGHSYRDAALYCTKIALFFSDFLFDLYSYLL
jgi:hypothetical protein